MHTCQHLKVRKTEQEILRGSEATEGGRVWGSFCIFGLKIVQSGAYLERKFRLRMTLKINVGCLSLASEMNGGNIRLRVTLK